jgi:tetraacyldisaccharide 4'-kinase
MKPIERRIVSNTLNLASYQHLFYSSIGYAPIQLNSTPLLVTGIANPKPLLEHLQQSFPDTELLAFSDHHVFRSKDLKKICEKAEQFDCVVTTEKDYRRLLQTPLVEQLGDKLQVMTIQTEFGVDEDAFIRAVLLYVSENNRKQKTPINNNATDIL